MDFDAAVVGGKAVLESGPISCDIGITNGAIAAIAAPGSIHDYARRVIDATGQIVIPGGIDPHVHCAIPLYNESLGDGLSKDPEHVSVAALHGGTTTILDFAYCPPERPLQRSIDEKLALWSKACCDFNLHVTVMGKVTKATLSELAETVEAGFPSVKVFLTNVTPSRQGRMVDMGGVASILRTLAPIGGVLAVHAEDDDLVMSKYQELVEEGRTGYQYMPAVHSCTAEEASIARLAVVARSIPGARLYIMHVSCQGSIGVIQDAARRGLDVRAETLQQYLCVTSEAYDGVDGPLFHTFPSLKSGTDQAALWRALDDGVISTIATDGLCTDHAVKVAGTGILDATGGHVGVEVRLGLMYDEGVIGRGWKLTEWVERVSTNAAKIFGMYPQKGVIAVGSDADLVLFDPAKHVQLSASNLHESDYTPWEGRIVRGWPKNVLLRGQVVVSDGELQAGAAGMGRRVFGRRREMAGESK